MIKKRYISTCEVKVTCDRVTRCEILVLIGDYAFRTTVGLLISSNSVRVDVAIEWCETGAHSEEKPSRVGAVQPPGRACIPRDVPRSLSLLLMMQRWTATYPAIASGGEDHVPYGSGAGCRATETASGGVVTSPPISAAAGASEEVYWSGGEAVVSCGDVEEGERREDPRFGASAQYTEHHRGNRRLITDQK